jgi:2-amino-4-hydroxy-6-hydroxymethyldihydropteridine diphosphokinase
MNEEHSRLAVIALGSNLGDSVALIDRAIAALEKVSDQPVLRSSLWKSKPVDCPPGSPDFVNAVVAIKPSPTDTPENLLGKLQAIERQLGRGPKQTDNEPRPIDLDLIAFGNHRISNEYLTLPHPRAHLRKFVLGPLAEILPDFEAPGWSRESSALLANCPATEEAVRIHL